MLFRKNYSILGKTVKKVIHMYIKNVHTIRMGKGFYMKKILVTGGAGFIGSNFIQYLLREKKELSLLVNLDLLTYAGNPENLVEVASDPRYYFVRGDVRDKALVDSLFQQYDFDTVVHFAAESHVDRSIAEPEVFLTTNVIGTQVLLDAAKNHWKLTPKDHSCRAYRPGVRYLQVSTDEVYGALGDEGRFSEATPLSPSSPYSASKAGADLLVHAYYKTYGLPVNITRCSNNYGPYQYPEKLIPLMIYKAVHHEPLPVYGDGMQVRDWLHVTDHCSALLAVLEKGRIGEVYNVGGSNEMANIEIVRLVLRELQKPESLITHVKDRPGHDRRYAIDNTKITTELGWLPAYTFEKGMADTISWYLAHMDWLEKLMEKKAGDG